MYVQHRLREQGEKIVRLIMKENAFFFVCGDGRAMVSQVQKTIEELICKHAGLDKKGSESYVAGMKKDHRYVTDQWS